MRISPHTRELPLNMDLRSRSAMAVSRISNYSTGWSVHYPDPETESGTPHTLTGLNVRFMLNTDYTAYGS